MRDEIYVGALFSSDYLAHYGKGHDDNPPGRGSGRYPYGSGKRPHQHEPARRTSELSSGGGANTSVKRAQVKPVKYDPGSRWSIDSADEYARVGADIIAAAIINPAIRESDKRVSSQPVDSETGFHMKVKPWSSKADTKAVNPGYENFLSLTSNNCMACTTTYDMRRRGFDVRAKQKLEGYYYTDIARWYVNPKTYTYNLSKDDYTKYGDVKPKYWEYITKDLTSQGNGARGNFMFDWKVGGGGHSIVYEIQDGNLIFRDCQSGNDRIKPEMLFRDIDPKGIEITRLDNLQFNPKHIKECCR